MKIICSACSYQPLPFDYLQLTALSRFALLFGLRENSISGVFDQCPEVKRDAREKLV